MVFEEFNSVPRKEEKGISLECIHCIHMFDCKLEKLKGGCLNFEDRDNASNTEDD